ncbi:hypothetical protein GPECTOR_16g728 [Gonium pectorale]|uniref:ABC transporter domain-containing protein n=1 Tax=Gonium pectorale TaxID=33097 RepID=A0A150GL56_GONPE|nr:hypothetical protein GPECTOR_16g728 [Gonium pectorale]|eukprot:KXZ50553.1 hypothetical protein GPECTOR_16g728 [Gonium pectorale]
MLKSQSSALRKEGALIEWSDVSYTVHDRATGQKKRILADMTGMAQPGRLLSIMGPSGAGKSTLLDVLACNNSNRTAVPDGRILVDGAPRNDRAFGRISCYVQQKDVLLASATVREVILTSALLKLPRSVSVAEKRARVEATLKELDLTACANTLIGEETIGLKGISGGQKRRVSVGIELVKASAAGFFTFFAVFSMFQVISEGIGACCAVATRTSTSAIILLTFVLLLVLSFSGFLTVKTPIYFVWVQKTSYLTYAFSALLEREFSDISFRDADTGEVLPGMQAFPASLRTGLTYAQNIGVLAGQVGGMELVKLAVFHIAHRLELL